MDKTIDESVYNAKSLNILNIKELRSLGKQLGVSSPASKSKNELIDLILKIIYGEIVPERNNLGRPTKSKFDFDKCIKKIKDNSDYKDEYKYKIFFHTRDYGMQLLSTNKEQYQSNECVEKRFFCNSNGRYYLRVRGFVESKDDIEINSDFVKKFKLENLDIVEIKRIKNSIKFYSINGVKIDDNLSITIDEKIINGGTNQDFYFSTKEEIMQNINLLIENYSKKDTKIIIFAENEYSGDNIVLFKYDKNEKGPILYKKLMCFIDTCEKFSTFGEDLVILIEDKFEIDEILSYFDEDVFQRTKQYFQDVFTGIIGVGNICVFFGIQTDIKY